MGGNLYQKEEKLDSRPIPYIFRDFKDFIVQSLPERVVHTS